MKGKRWFSLSNKMKADYVEIATLEQDPCDDSSEKEERKITIGKVKHAMHAAMCDSGYLWVLDYVLRNKQDGDIEVETLKSIVYQYNIEDETYWQSERNYLALVDLFSRWGRECIDSIDTLNK